MDASNWISVAAVIVGAVVAAFTIRLAIVTERMARATESSVKASQDSIAASIQPLLIDLDGGVSVGQSGSAFVGRLFVKISNVGRGHAIVTRAGLVLGKVEVPPSGRAPSLIKLGSEQGYFFDVNAGEFGLALDGPDLPCVVLRYTDTSGSRSFESRIQLADHEPPQRESGNYATRTDLMRGGETFASA